MKIISVLSENDLDHYKFIYDICIEVFLLIKKYIDANIGKTEEFEEETFNSIRNLLHQNSLEDIEDALKKFFKRSILIIQRSSEVMENTIVANAKQYINEHFGEHVTLSTIAKAVYVHPIYLSKLFKDKTGENFIDYLTNVRMKKAKELLKNPSFKIYDISYMVGYESSKHFSKVFKDETGMTPREYRNKSL